jgi:FKBP-type peptidyl-prolyl cis-trans isomerase
MQKTHAILSIVGIVIILVSSLFIFGFVEFPSKKVNVTIKPTKMDNNQTELKIEDIQEGTGPEVKSGDTITIHYLGTLEDGTKFDSSYDRGEPFKTQIGVGQVIEGWDKGVVGMKIGGKRKLIIPASMAYGDRDLPGIPAGSTLIFEVELVGVNN